MIKIGKLCLNGIPRIAVSFRDHTPRGFLRKAREKGVDVAELRIDQYTSFDPAHVLNEITKFKNFPTIATIRSREEGGGWNLSEKDRLSLFKAILPKIDAIDIELSAKAILAPVVKAAHAAGKLAIISYHNFERTPKGGVLNRILKQAKSSGADIVKLATMTLSGADIRALAAFTLAHADKNLIAITMGAQGVISRILFPALGSLITYASFGEPTAPGQMRYERTLDLLRIFYPKFDQEKTQKLKLFRL